MRRRATSGLPVWLTLLAALSPAALPAEVNPRHLRVVAALSAGQTGIVDAIARDFEAARPGITVETNYVGALEALDVARRGEADVVITHHPPSEDIFIAEGYGATHVLIMYNQFAIFGPPNDIVRLSDATNPLTVLRQLAHEEVFFMVPGRRSGTYKRLEELWTAAGLDPGWIGYESTGSSAAQTLTTAATFGAYAFADMGTFVANRQQLAGKIAPVFRDHSALRNNYAAITVNAKRIPAANQPLAEIFVEYLVSDKVQAQIAHYGQDEYGGQIYIPAAQFDEGLRARRTAQQLQRKTTNLTRLAGLTALLALLSVVATWLFARTRKLELVSRASEQRFALAVSGSNDGIWDWDCRANTVYLSPRLYEILEYTNRPGVIADPLSLWEEHLHPDDRDAARTLVADYLASKATEPFVSEHRLRTANDDYRWVLLRGRAVRDETHRTARVSGSISDISARKQQEAALEYQAVHDSLTGLPNRVLLLDRLQQAIHLAARERHSGALLVMDLDRFKEINDTLGHDVGDRLLKEVGERLKHALRKSDTVVRLGGDEFAVVLPSADDTYANHVAHKIHLLLAKVFAVSRHSLHIGGSVGIALYPQHGEDAQTLLKRADVAMYIAKRASSGCAVYDETHDQGSVRRLEIANELHDALDADGLELHYQPEIDLKSRKIVGVEALLRWQHPRRGMVRPDEMIRIAEHSGLIGPLTMWVVDTALSQWRQWHKQGIDLKIAVNLSVWNMQDPQLADGIARKLAAHDVPAAKLELEVTESTTMSDPERFRQVLEELDALGVKLVIDDFGTGFSSLAYLNKLPFDAVKIDRSFVMGMEHDRDNAMIVRSVIDLGHTLGFVLVAEGVENEDALNYLLGLGCDTAQGYYFARPLPAEALVRWLDESAWGLGSKVRQRSAG